MGGAPFAPASERSIRGPWICGPVAVLMLGTMQCGDMPGSQGGQKCTCTGPRELWARPSWLFYATSFDRKNYQMI
jgi:hypothetical protein